MKIYRVGGSVRDQLMGLTPHDHDYVVVGATPAEMEALGYQQVGKDFPVYLHPETKEEYALARIERKTGLKHTDFETSFDPTVTIEEDLRRRDLTINAIAIPHNFEGDIVDPFGGVADIENGVLRHVSEAFREDPLRVLRLARFKARFPEFIIDEDTYQFVKIMMENDELRHISQDRIWQETKKALVLDNAHVYFDVMDDYFEVLDYILGHNYDLTMIYFEDTREKLKNVIQVTAGWSDEDKVNYRMAFLLSHMWEDFDNGFNDGSKDMKEIIRQAKMPAEVADLAVFIGKNESFMTGNYDIDECAEHIKKMSIKPFIQRDPDFLQKWLAVGKVAFDLSDATVEFIQKAIEASLDTKIFLEGAIKRFEWMHNRAPKPLEIKELLDAIISENIDAAWRGIHYAQTGRDFYGTY